ncbi:hypothetical protein EDD21DRAFT_421637 [Dissophora ornata]|nr:hypothetical protein BGZ58_001333 [Dissophora ornata]KAI8594511.1 hypothetical protein EDD21DRAFT_421637 [Dissophora ornata]
MSTAQVIVPTPMAGAATTPRTGLSSIRTIFSTNALTRHSITPLPSSTSPKRSNSNTASVYGSVLGTPSSVSVSSLFPGTSPKRSSMERAAERDWAEQAKQVYQLSTVNDQGAFVPPTPLEKDFKEYLVDHNEDYFETIINTPPERVRTFLSTESTISPGMFSTLPSSKIKRHSMPSFSSPPTPSSPASPTSNKSTSALDQRHHKSNSDSNSNKKGTNNNKNNNVVQPQSKRNSKSFTEVDITAPSSPTPANSLMTPPSSPPAVPTKDIAYFPVSPPSTPQPQPRSRSRPQSSQAQFRYQPSPPSPQEKPQPRHPQSSELNRANEAKRRSRAQLSFLTGAPSEEEDLIQTLIDPFLLSSSPPDLVTDSEGGEQSDVSSSAASSPNASPRYSTVSSSEQIRRLNAQKLRAQNDFGSDLPIAR